MHSILEYVPRYSGLPAFISIPQVLLFSLTQCSIFAMSTLHPGNAFTIEMLYDDVDWNETCTRLYALFSSCEITSFTATGLKKRATLHV